MDEGYDPIEMANTAIDSAQARCARDNQPLAWFSLAYCALRLMAIFVSSYMKRGQVAA